MTESRQGQYSVGAGTVERQGQHGAPTANNDQHAQPTGKYWRSNTYIYAVVMEYSYGLDVDQVSSVLPLIVH